MQRLWTSQGAAITAREGCWWLRKDPRLVRRAELRAKLRSLLWRAWARYRPIFGGVVLRYTSLREQYVYRRAAKLYAAAFASDPGKSGRALAAWLRRATPMETETEAVAGSVGSQPPSKRAKKSWAEAARAALPAA